MFIFYPILILFFFFCSPYQGGAQDYISHEYLVKNVTGISYPSIRGITQDEQGLIWFNSIDKVGYYDGQKVEFLDTIQEKLQASTIIKIIIPI